MQATGNTFQVWLGILVRMEAKFGQLEPVYKKLVALLSTKERGIHGQKSMDQVLELLLMEQAPLGL